MSEATYPEELLYHPDHDWARIDDAGIAEFGVTWFAQDSLGDVVFFDPKEVGSSFGAGQSYGELESVKTVSDLIAPLDGEIVAVNQEVVDSPELVNEDPYKHWLVRVKVTDPAQRDSLLSAAAYADLVR